MANYTTDTEFKPSGMLAPLVFIILFVLFIYSTLMLGLTGIANKIIHEQNLIFFMQYGSWGAFFGACTILLIWAAFVLVLAAIPYLIIKDRGNEKKARLVGQVIIFLMFHVFTLPFILWPMVRRSSAALRAKHTAKLRRKVSARQNQAHRAKPH